MNRIATLYLRIAFVLLAAAAMSVGTSLATIGTCDIGPVEIEATAGVGGPTSYPDLGAAFGAINAGTHNGDINVEICADTAEAVSAVLNASGAGPALYDTVLVSPIGGARVVTGAIAGALIDLNGADSVTISGANLLTIDNTSTSASASTIRFIGDASSDSVQNCTIRGAGTGTTSGTIFFSTGTATGNTGISISGNTITSSGASLPTNAIYSAGTSGAIPNNGITIQSNNIQDYFSATSASNGVFVTSNSSAWTIDGNRFFQSATRTATSANTHRAIAIINASGSGYTITNNVIGFATSGGTGTTTYDGAVASRFYAIELQVANSPVSSIQGNTVSGISLSTTSGLATGAGIFSGINITAGGVNVGNTTANVIGAATGTGAIAVTSTTSGAVISGIVSVSTGSVTIQGNSIGSISTGGGAAIGYTFRGIDTAGVAGSFTITSNTIGSTSTANSIAVGTSGTTTAITTFVGILSAGTGTNSITSNTIQNCSAFGTSTSVFTGITNTGALAGSTLNINGNNIIAGTNSGTGAFTGISNTAAVGTLTINSNVLRNHTRGGTSGAFTGITTTGLVTTALSVNSNQLGNSGNPLVTYSLASSGALIGINASGPTAATVSISSNAFHAIVQGTTGSNSHTYITWNNATSAAANINDNTFNNITAGTTGSVTFLTRAGSMTATGSENVNGNQIVTQFTKSGSTGSVTFFGANASSVNGSTMTNNLNIFSNVNIVGTTTIAGWSNTEGASSTNGPTKTITNNTFSTLTATTTPTGSITGMNINFSGAGTTVSTNTVSNVTGGGAFTGIVLGSSNSTTSLTVSQNVVDPITTLAGAVTAISSAAPSVTLSKNKIYDLSGTGAGSTVNGILITGGTTVNVVNNLIGDLKAASATGVDVIRGISSTSTTTLSNINVHYNTVFLNATGGVTTFGTSGVFHTISTTSTTAALSLRNNIIVNTSNRVGATGFTVAYRRSGGAASNLNNYAASSNNNDFYAGTPSATNLIYYDGTSSAQTINDYRNGVFTAGTVAPRDSASFTENPSFVSTTGSNANFLHINTGPATQIESGGANIAGITDDFDGNIRQGNGGYGGTGTAPDVGADEFEGTALDLSPPVISYSLLGNVTDAPSRAFSPVTVTDASGVNVTAGTRPRVYYKKGCDANNTWNDNTSATVGWKFAEATGGGGSPFSFTIDYSRLPACGGGSGAGDVVAGDVVQYFVVAQDLAGPNVGINSGSFAATPASVALTGAAFPIGGTINSYIIATVFSGSYNVGTGQAFTSLTNAGGIFEAINNGVVGGNVAVHITSDLAAETGTILLNRFVEEGGSGFTLTFDSSAATLRTISGSGASGLVRLNGAQRTTFDGRVGGTGQFLRFRNTSTAGPTFTFINDATNNTIQSCIVEGSVTSTTSGTILFSTSTGTLGNSSNTIAASDIRDRSDAAGVPANGVYSSGSASAPNGSNTISGCNVFNYTNAGVLVSATGAGNGWTVNPSNFYQTAARTTALTGIAILGGSGHSVLNNSVGGTAPGAGGSFLSTSSTFRGIDLSVGTASATSVQGNVIKNVRSTFAAGGFEASYGIFLQAGRADIGTVSGNTVGSSNAAERIEINGDCYGIRVSSVSTVNLHNNTVQNFQTRDTAPLPPTGEFYWGIRVDGTAGTHSVVNNTVANVTNFSVPDATFSTQTIGLDVRATGIQTVRGNRISAVGSTSTAAPAANNNRVWGLIFGGTAVGTVVQGNTVTGLFGSSAGTGARSDVITGVQSETTANASLSNNMVALDGGGGTHQRLITGMIELSTATTSYLHNSVNVTGSADPAGTTNTYAFNRNSTAAISLRNNAFVNTRSGGTGFHVAMANTNASATGWSASASNNNVLRNTDPLHVTQWLGSAGGNNLTLASFKTATGGDAASFEANPLFVSPTDLHINISGGPSPVENAGAAGTGITTDFDGNARFPIPDIGADEVDACSVSTCIDTDCGDVACDPAGLSGNCDSVTAKPNTTECRPAGGACDPADLCDGTNTGACQANVFSSGNQCRTAAGLCDIAETCTGSSADCPTDEIVDADVECRQAAGDCDIAEACTGSSVDCPNDVLVDADVECREAAGDCDIAEACTGSSAACPNDVLVDADVECRESSGAECDPAESCTGKSADCPPDAFDRNLEVGFTVTGAKPGSTISWIGETEPGPFNVYRGSITPETAWTYNHVCYVPGETTESVTDGTTPGSGITFYYLVSRVEPPCDESSLGDDSEGNEIPNDNPCGSFLDSDGDNVPDAMDNCPLVYNPRQEATDAEFLGTQCSSAPVDSAPLQGDTGNIIGDTANPD